MTLLLSLVVGLVPTAPPETDNLQFARGTLQGWQGEGFYLTPASGAGPSLAFGVCSSDAGPIGRAGLLHRTFLVPNDVGTLHASAFATGETCSARLNIYVEASGRKIIPKRVQTAQGYEVTEHLLVARGSSPRRYVWDLSAYRGELVRIVLLDQDLAPGRHVFSSGFRLEALGKFDVTRFSEEMSQLTRVHKLNPLGPRFRSTHFVALGNTDEQFTRKQLEQCELLYEHFLGHFRHKGFNLVEPASPLMIALFDRQEGLEAYMGMQVPSAVTGVYHPPSNRLVIYDFGRNRAMLERREAAQRDAEKLSPQDRLNYLGTVGLQASTMRADANLSTIMHEAAHQMSFNTGMFQREADHPIWLVEGLATYCEPTEQGRWQGIGASNTERLRPLRRWQQGKAKLLPLRALLENDQWLRMPSSPEQPLMGYAQSWAFFRMLMEENPRALARYIKLIEGRRTPDNRLSDFAQVFGSDLNQWEQRHQAYLERRATGLVPVVPPLVPPIP